MSERFAVLLRFYEIRDATTLTLFTFALAMLVGWQIVKAAPPISAERNRQMSMIYLAICALTWVLWLIALAFTVLQ